jgi:hypothetical protein
MIPGCIAIIADVLSSAILAAWAISPGCIPPQLVMAAVILLAIATAVAIHAYFVSGPFANLVDLLAAMIVAASLAILGISLAAAAIYGISGCLA